MEGISGSSPPLVVNAQGALPIDLILTMRTFSQLRGVARAKTTSHPSTHPPTHQALLEELHIMQEVSRDT